MLMRPTKVLVAKLDHNMLDIEMGINATCCVAISLIGLSSLASMSRRSLTAFNRCYNLLLLAGVALSGIAGCSDGSGVPIRGRLTFNGQPNSGEILIEAINSDGSPLEGVVPLTVFADERGEFTNTLGTNSSASYDCRVSIRIAQETASGRPASFDYDARPEKRVDLHREISGQQLNFAISR
jgi:hypothetical protein